MQLVSQDAFHDNKIKREIKFQVNENKKEYLLIYKWKNRFKGK